ncbi:MAG TPA: hypothetical protein VN366_03060 [Feifaniaceae bacterium]|nr:hypothetical protein [Feifaniaceae bacterium]
MGIAAWWEGLDTLLQVLYCVAIPASVVLLIQIVLTLAGFGHDAAGADTGVASGGADIGDMTDVDIGDFDFGDAAGADAYTPSDTGGADARAGYGALKMFTLEGVIAFLTVFGWTSIIAYNSQIPGGLAVFVGFVFGALAMFGVAKLIQLTLRLAGSGNISLKNALGLTARVYIPIPAGGKGEGKVNLTLQERFVEVNAITEGKAIPTGAFVRVVDVRADVLVVEKED